MLNGAKSKNKTTSAYITYTRPFSISAQSTPPHSDFSMVTLFDNFPHAISVFSRPQKSPILRWIRWEYLWINRIFSWPSRAFFDNTVRVVEKNQPLCKQWPCPWRMNFCCLLEILSGSQSYRLLIKSLAIMGDWMFIHLNSLTPSLYVILGLDFGCVGESVLVIMHSMVSFICYTFKSRYWTVQF